MGWDLGTLTPGQTKSITVAVMFGTKNWSYPTILTKTNADPNNGCVAPSPHPGNNTVSFDICYDANSYPLEDAILTDYLPAEVDFYSCTGGGVYDSNNHKITWNLGDVGGNDGNCFEVVATVNYYAHILLPVKEWFKVW
jgi:hypothetical protein